MRPGTTTPEGLRIQRLLGPGTYLATRRGSRQKEVVQLVEGPLQEDTDLLRADSLELASLRHPGFAQVLGFGRDIETGQPFVRRRYIEGSDILQVTRELPSRRMVPWFLAAARILAMLHRLGFLHGNLKVTNWLVSGSGVRGRRGRTPHLVLCDPDWRARSGGPHAEEVAPEVRDGGEPTFASDLFSLGAVF